MRLHDTTDEPTGLRVAGTVLPRLELRGFEVLQRSGLTRERVGNATVIWPHGDRGRSDDVCWVGLGRVAHRELAPSALPPLPAVEFRGLGLERLERAGTLDEVLRQEGLVRALRYDVRVHGHDGRLEQLLWSVALAQAPLARACDGRRHRRFPRHVR